MKYKTIESFRTFSESDNFYVVKLMPKTGSFLRDYLDECSLVESDLKRYFSDFVVEQSEFDRLSGSIKKIYIHTQEEDDDILQDREGWDSYGDMYFNMISDGIWTYPATFYELLDAVMFKIFEDNEEIGITKE